MTDEEKARGEVFALLAKWCGDVGECFNVSVSEHTAGQGPRRVHWYSGDSFGFTAEYRAQTWTELHALMDAEPEGYFYQNDWSLSKPAADMLAMLEYY